MEAYQDSASLGRHHPFFIQARIHPGSGKSPQNIRNTPVPTCTTPVGDCANVRGCPQSASCGHTECIRVPICGSRTSVVCLNGPQAAGDGVARDLAEAHSSVRGQRNYTQQTLSTGRSQCPIENAQLKMRSENVGKYIQFSLFLFTAFRVQPPVPATMLTGRIIIIFISSNITFTIWQNAVLKRRVWIARQGLDMNRWALEIKGCGLDYKIRFGYNK